MICLPYHMCPAVFLQEMGTVQESYSTRSLPLPMCQLLFHGSLALFFLEKKNQGMIINIYLLQV